MPYNTLTFLLTQGSHSLAYKKIQDFSRTFHERQKGFSRTLLQPSNVKSDKQHLLTMYTIHRKMFITSCKKNFRLAHTGNTSYIYLHMVFYT